MVKTGIYNIHTLVVTRIQKLINFYELCWIICLTYLLTSRRVYMWTWAQWLNILRHLYLLCVSSCTFWATSGLVSLEAPIYISSHLLFEMGWISHVQTQNWWHSFLFESGVCVFEFLDFLETTLVQFNHVLNHVRSFPLCSTQATWCLWRRMTCHWSSLIPWKWHVWSTVNVCIIESFALISA